MLFFANRQVLNSSQIHYKLLQANPMTFEHVFIFEIYHLMIYDALKMSIAILDSNGMNTKH